MRILKFNMSNFEINVLDSGTALGRAAIAVANCGEAEETGFGLRGGVVEARGLWVES